MSKTGRPPKPLPPDPDEFVPVTMKLRSSGVRWLDEAAAAATTPEHTWTRSDVMRAALREYRTGHPLPAERPARPAPKTAPARHPDPDSTARRKGGNRRGISE